ncbi:TrmH family RNA methyltransferase [Candidatus Uhrbacteria bacterium]|nr:TrmH family RNA methyltransferase [Candidatus Uhrbacteria bacterium]
MKIIVHNIRSLYNVGAFFRNADAFGVSHIYLSGYTATPPRLEISKTALGADETISWSKHEDVLELIDELKAENERVYAFESDPSFVHLDQVKPDHDAVLIFGNEPDGLATDILDRASERVYIPMRGEKTSLNVSVASGIALYAMSL